MWLPTPTDKQVAEFADLYEHEFGKRLTKEEAADVASRFLQLYWILTRTKAELQSEAVSQRQVKDRRRRTKSQAMKRSTKLIKH